MRTSQPYRARAERPFRTHALGAVVGVLLAAGCATVPAVSEPDRVDARTLYAETPVEWQSRARACMDAGDRARAAAARTCRLRSVSVPREACTCRPGVLTAGVWRCTASATYTCAGDAMVADR